MAHLTLFLDDGGVLNDNRPRGAQWRRLVAQYFAPRLGGSPEAWAEANREVITGFFEPGAWQARLLAAPDYESFERAYNLDWLGGMCAIVGVPRPSEEESIALSRQATAWIIPQVQSAYPGAVETVRLLHAQGYTLHTASGSSSTDLEGYLRGMGVRACFGRLYGPDLIGAFKVGPEFYERVLADAGVAPGDALVLDDNPDALNWAAQAGARTVLVSPTPPPQNAQPPQTISSLADLPSLLERLASG